MNLTHEVVTLLGVVAKLEAADVRIRTYERAGSPSGQAVPHVEIDHRDLAKTAKLLELKFTGRMTHADSSRIGFSARTDTVPQVTIHAEFPIGGDDIPF